MAACPNCKHPNAYIGFKVTTVECPNVRCVHYSESWAREVRARKETGRLFSIDIDWDVGPTGGS